MTTRTCPRCDAPILHGTLCEDCLATLRRDLDAIGELITELHTQLARQNRTAGGTTAPRATDPDPMPTGWHDPDVLAIAAHPLPYDQRASDALELLRSVLVGWTRDTTPRSQQPPDQLHALAAHLAAHDWRNHPAADELADEIHWTIGQIRHAIDTPPPSRYLGPCGAVLEDASTCPGDVYQVGTKLPRCWTCHATHSADERMAWIADVAADQLVTAAIAAGALSAWGEHIKPDLIRLWAHRGRLVAHGHDQRGRPLYRFSECRALALDTLRHRPPASPRHAEQDRGA